MANGHFADDRHHIIAYHAVSCTLGHAFVYQTRIYPALKDDPKYLGIRGQALFDQPDIPKSFDVVVSRITIWEGRGPLPSDPDEGPWELQRDPNDYRLVWTLFCRTGHWREAREDPRHD